MNELNADEHSLIGWGRCRSGKRWFWAAHEFMPDHGPNELYGWAETEAEAEDVTQAAVTSIAAGRPHKTFYRGGIASSRLKEFNAERRTQRPAKGNCGAERVEFLYGVDVDSDGHKRLVEFPVTKRTAKRVHYQRNRPGPRASTIGFVDRQELEAKGDVYNRSRGWWDEDFHLYAEPPDLSPAQTSAPDLVKLRAAMAAAHPDRGGSDEAFRAARAAYVTARGQTRASA